MRRPAAFVGIAYVLGMAAEFFLKLSTLAVIMFMAVLLTLLCFFSFVFVRDGDKKRRYLFAEADKRMKCLIFVAVIAASVGSLVYAQSESNNGRLCVYEGEYITIHGTVISIRQQEKDFYKLIIKVKSIDDIKNTQAAKSTQGVKNTEETTSERFNEKIAVNLYGEMPEYHRAAGRNVVIKGFIELPGVRRNPKGFDYRTYLKTKGIFVTMETHTENFSLSEDIENIYINQMEGIRHNFKKNIYHLLEEEKAGLLTGMIFGDNSGLSEETYETFQKNGICHILAVSGLHVGALYMCINAVCKGRNRTSINIIIITALMFYASLADFSPSVVRSVMMISLHIASKFFCKKYDMFTSSVITMAVMLSFNPALLLNLGFQLSFTAIFTLAVVLPSALRIYDKYLTTVVVIQSGIAPLSAYVFNYFSFSAFVANIPVVFLGGILIPLGLMLFGISTVASFIPAGLDANILSLLAVVLDILFRLTTVAVSAFLGMLMAINDFVFIEKVSYKYVVSPPLELLFLYYGVLFFWASESFRIMWQRKHYSKITGAIFLLTVTAFLLGGSAKDGFENTQMIFLDVGQGDCLLIRTDEGKNVLIDSGGSHQYDVGKKTLLPCLLKNGIKEIDVAVITHRHADHMGGIISLAKEIDVKKIAVYEGNKVEEGVLSEEFGIAAEDFLYLTKGNKLELGKDLSIDVLYPEKKSEEEYRVIMENKTDENQACLVVKVNFKGVTVMMTGDIDIQGEGDVLAVQEQESFLRSDILKVAHHGSKYGSSDSFLEAVSPKAAVVQVGKNNYGHPNSDTLQRIESAGAAIYRNDLQGAIGIEIKKDGIVKIHTMIKR